MEIDLGKVQSSTRTEVDSPAFDAKWVANYLGISKQQVYASAADGTIPAFKPCGDDSRTVRFVKDKIVAYREQSRIRPRPTLKSVTPQNTVLPCDDDSDFKIEAVRLCG